MAGANFQFKISSRKAPPVWMPLPSYSFNIGIFGTLCVYVTILMD